MTNLELRATRSRVGKETVGHYLIRVCLRYDYCFNRRFPLKRELLDGERTFRWMMGCFWKIMWQGERLEDNKVERPII